jgi:hydroxymethylglutaryl-CoA lyase
MSPMRQPVMTPSDGLPQRVRIWEVGPRDGLQNEATVISSGVKIAFIDRVPQLADGATVMAGITRKPGVRYPVLVPNLRGLESAVASDARDIAVFASATESFAQRNLGRSLDDQMSMFEPVLASASSRGIPVRGYVSMCFGDPWEGAVDPSGVVDVCLQLLSAGCSDISLGDTIGVATPGQVRTLIDLLERRGVELDRIGVHFHDTYGQALSNTLAALQCGVTTVDASTGGLGGCPYAESATGNLATEDLVWMLDGLGIETGVDLEKLVETSIWLARYLGKPISSRVTQALSQ